MADELTVKRDYPRPGQAVVWLQQRKWGGKQNQPAIFLRPIGKCSARIASDGVNRTVRLSSLEWDAAGER